jgi:predicted transcriptional regulator
MKSEHKHELDNIERRIVDIIYQRGLASVEQVHQLIPEMYYVEVMRKIHRLCRDGYLLQTHLEGVAYYELPFKTVMIRKSVIDNQRIITSK